MLILRALFSILSQVNVFLIEFYTKKLIKPLFWKWKLIAYWANNARYGEFKLVKKRIRPKNQFRHLIYYSMPNSILFIVKKRLNLVFTFTFILITLFLSIL